MGSAPIKTSDLSEACPLRNKDENKRQSARGSGPGPQAAVMVLVYGIHVRGSKREKPLRSHWRTAPLPPGC